MGGRGQTHPLSAMDGGADMRMTAPGASPVGAQSGPVLSNASATERALRKERSILGCRHALGSACKNGNPRFPLKRPDRVAYSRLRDKKPACGLADRSALPGNGIPGFITPSGPDAPMLLLCARTCGDGDTEMFRICAYGTDRFGSPVIRAPRYARMAQRSLVERARGLL